jgi:hypothetical protein
MQDDGIRDKIHPIIIEYKLLVSSVLEIHDLAKKQFHENTIVVVSDARLCELVN